MPLQPYLHLIKSQADFKKNFVDEEAPLFAELKNEPASKWGRKELFACRVLPKQGDHNLPCLKSFKSTERFTTAQMKAFVDGPVDPADLGGSELALVRKYGHSLGQLWAALAAFTGPPERRKPFSPPDEGSGGGDNGNNDDDGNNNGGGGDGARWPKRARHSTQQQGFVDSSTLKFDSNSPIPSSQGSQGSLGYVDAESHALAAGPEDDTLRLITCALRHVLYFAAPNNEPNAAAVVEVRDAKIRLDNNIGVRSLVAVDDGGLCLREPQIFEHRRSDGSLCQRTVYTTANNHVLMLETKRMLQCLTQGVPIISDACLAQMTCQALSCRIDNSGRDSVIILHAAQNYVCFVQFDMSTDYLLGLSSETPTEFLHF
ncbi:hypothetical protein NHJ13734_008499 [Beauveria thailandica]